MTLLSYSGYRFPRDIIQRAVWMYLRFTLSFRDVEELFAGRGITVSHESIRRWVLTLPVIARMLQARRPKRMGDGTSMGWLPALAAGGSISRGR
jgi:putative transposase